jgi:hypothetical protein
LAATALAAASSAAVAAHATAQDAPQVTVIGLQRTAQVCHLAYKRRRPHTTALVNRPCESELVAAVPPATCLNRIACDSDTETNLSWTKHGRGLRDLQLARHANISSKCAAATFFMLCMRPARACTSTRTQRRHFPRLPSGSGRGPRRCGRRVCRRAHLRGDGGSQARRRRQRAGLGAHNAGGPAGLICIPGRRRRSAGRRRGS